MLPSRTLAFQRTPPYCFPALLIVPFCSPVCASRSPLALVVGLSNPRPLEAEHTAVELHTQTIQKTHVIQAPPHSAPLFSLELGVERAGGLYSVCACL